MDRVLNLVKTRREAVILVALVALTFAFPGKISAGVYGLGIVSGASLALSAIGIVLVYRTNRIINFAQVAMGAVPGYIFLVMARAQPLFSRVREICETCIDRITPLQRGIGIFVGLLVAIGISILIGLVMYYGLIKFFARAPRLVVTIATIFAVQVLSSLAPQAGRVLFTAAQKDRGVETLLAGGAKAPFKFGFTMGGVPFDATQILTVLLSAAAVSGLAIYFRRSRSGIAIRAAAENPERVQMLGVNVDSVVSRVWVIASLLAAVGGIAAVMTAAPNTEGSLDVATIVRVLTAAVIGGMSSLPMAAAAAIVIGILGQTVQASFGSTTPLDALMVVGIGVILLLQQNRTSRAEVAQASSWQAAREIRRIPSQLRDLPGVRSYRRGLIIAGVIVVGGLPWVLSPSQSVLISVAMIYGYIGLSLLVLTGWAGQISLGQFAFAAIGAWTVGVLRLPLPLELLAAGIVGAGAALLLGFPALKLRGLYFAILTLAFALSVSAVVISRDYLGKLLPERIDRPVLLGMDFDDERIFFYFTIVMLALAVAAVTGIKRSRTARALIAARDNEQAAQSFQINVVTARLSAFAISGFLAAFGGGLYAVANRGVEPIAFIPERSIQMFLFTIVGGLGSVASPILGVTVVLGLLLLVLSNPIVQGLVSGGGGLMLLFMAPGGIGQLVFSARDAMLRRVAIRNRVVVPSLLADEDVNTLTRQKVRVAANQRVGGGSAFVPERYRLDGQWAHEADMETLSQGAEVSARRQAEERLDQFLAERLRLAREAARQVGREDVPARTGADDE